MGQNQGRAAHERVLLAQQGVDGGAATDVAIVDVLVVQAALTEEGNSKPIHELNIFMETWEKYVL